MKIIKVKSLLSKVGENHNVRQHILWYVDEKRLKHA